MPTWTAKTLAEVIAGCQEETQRRGRGPEEGACYELFRRAIVDGCQAAWDTIYAQYNALVARWLIGPCEPDQVHDAWLRFVQALPAGRFASARHVGDVLALLRRCARSVAIDAGRRAERERKAQVEWRRLQGEPVKCEENGVLDRVAGRELWAHVRPRLQDEQERLVVLLSFVDGLPPREIAARYPQHFPDVRTVYQVKERVVDRLSRDPHLLRWRSERDSSPKKCSPGVE